MDAAFRSSTADLRRRLRPARRLGWATMLLVLGVGGGLGATVPLAGAALAPGFVSPDGSRKSVQHLEGGIVESIMVREGDVVTAGQPLLTLQDVRVRAEFAEVRERLAHLAAVEARLVAERSGAARLATPDPDPVLDPGALAAALEGQRDLLASRREAREGREGILGRRILQLREETEGLREVIARQDEQDDLILQEIATVRDLVDRGLERTPRLLSLQRQGAEVRAERAANRARIARNAQAIGETELELLALRQQARERADEDLGSVRAELGTLRSRLPARSDALDRSIVAAPIAGTVMNVRVTSERGVVRAGEALLDIVPREARLVVDARLRPIDIDVVRPGQPAKVVLSALARRNLPEIRGALRSVSADRLTDERTGESYFLAKVEVDPESLRGASPAIELVPGMPAEVYVRTGDRTALDYLVRPFLDSLRRSFIEN